MDLTGVLRIAHEIAVSLPLQVTEHLARELDALKACPAPDKLVRLGNTGRSRELLSRLGTEWVAVGSDLEGRIVATALLAASQAVASSSIQRSAEIAWTGPSTSAVPTRRVDQVLYELIERASDEIWLASYVAYGADRAVDALAVAANRGVRVRLVLELASESGGKLEFDTARHLKSRLPSAEFYYWPLENRCIDKNGRHGILHAKCLISDRSAALISSANLTDYALELNIELGLVIRSGDIPRRLADHFAQLVVRGELRELS
jgi:phosphatidylserine/phosphatidylglycerophosphate/cardiolipin synthase-like enzyme